MYCKTNITIIFSPFPNKLRKTKVTLHVEITIVALNIEGLVKTARFITLVMYMWRYSNKKQSPETYYMLFAVDRKPFTNAKDQILTIQNH